MADRKTSRELAARVQQQFHRGGRPMRRWVNGLSVLCGLLVVGVLVAFAGRKHNWLYQAGPVAEPHRMFENNCAACHETWGPAARLVAISDTKSSVSEAKCQSCHAGPPHYPSQTPAHAGISCAACHREHRNDASLVHTANARCIACHTDLENHLPAAGGSTTFEPTVTDFATAHPEFAVLRSADAKDGARIRFNHAAHLQHEYDASGKLVKGVLNERGELEDLAKDCSTCHEPDVERKLMRPIHYESHCARCHPLLYDPAGTSQDVVPHERPEVVLGFLTRRAAIAALRDTDISISEGADLRRLPGVPYQPSLSVDQADQAEQQVREAERIALEHTHTLFGEEAKGGCRFCHDVRESTVAAGGGGWSLVDWEIVAPDIPDRWLSHAEFAHDSHRFLNCRECHHGVLESTQTSDILLPGIEDCRTCHGGGRKDARPPMLQPVRSRCIDCHSYHDRTTEVLAGSLTAELTPLEGMVERP